MTKYVGSTPQQFDACFSLFLFCISYDFFQISFVFFDACTFRNQVYIVETVVLDTHFLHEFETCIHFIFCSLYSVSITIPRELFCSATELVTAFSTQSMPPCHRKSQPIFHLLTVDYLFSIVVTECHRILTIFTFELNLFNSREKFFCCHNSFIFKWLLFRLLIIYLKKEPEPVCYQSSTFQGGISILHRHQHIPDVSPH